MFTLVYTSFYDANDSAVKYRNCEMQSAGAGGGGLEEDNPKLQYLKNLMLKYLGTDEGEAREHMERAIATVLQFSEKVRIIN